MKITVIGAGYVGFANALVLARHHDVAVVDVNAARVQQIQRGELTLGEAEIADFVKRQTLRLEATTQLEAAVTGATWVLIATPTDYNPDTSYFDTSSVESTIAATLACNPAATIIIKSTIPVGFTDSMRSVHGSEAIFFAPEFLREGKALHDCLEPTRVIVGGPGAAAGDYARMYADACDTPDVAILLTGAREAEAIKLFANTYLALRVAYFNEVDTYAVSEGLDARAIIEGIGLDPRIGSHYNNPSFGYGGYCLPKDTKQLLANYSDIPQDLISAVVKANETRQSFITADILLRRPSVVGVHRLVMKSGSDNFRASSIFGVIQRLRAAGVTVLIYEPSVQGDPVPGCELVADLGDFKARSDVIVANRVAADLGDVAAKVYTRDLYGRD